MSCVKCGSEDIHTAWHKSGFDCLYGSNTSPHDEHLHRHCRGCGYDWADKPMDAKEREKGGGGE